MELPSYPSSDPQDSIHFLEALSLGFVKVDFDGSVRNERGGAAFVIHGPDGRLLAASESHLFEPSILVAELHATWAGVTFARQQLRTERIFLEGDFATIISWIQRDARHLEVHLLIRDVWISLHQSAAVQVQHIYQEANTAVDWVAAFVAEHSDD